MRQHRCRLLNYCSTPTIFCSLVTNVRYNSTSTLEQGFPLFSTGSHSSPLPGGCRTSMLNLDETVLDICIGPHTAWHNRSRRGKASRAWGPHTGRPCIHVAPLPCKSRTQHQTKTAVTFLARTSARLCLASLLVRSGTNSGRGGPASCLGFRTPKSR